MQKKQHLLSYLLLFLVSGVFGIVVLIPTGYILSKFGNIPQTSYDNYGWRGFGVMLFFIGLYVVIDVHDIASIIFFAVTCVLAKGFIINWTSNHTQQQTEPI